MVNDNIETDKDSLRLRSPFKYNPNSKKNISKRKGTEYDIQGKTYEESNGRRFSFSYKKKEIENDNQLTLPIKIPNKRNSKSKRKRGVVDDNNLKSKKNDLSKERERRFSFSYQKPELENENQLSPPFRRYPSSNKKIPLKYTKSETKKKKSILMKILRK